MSTTPSKRKPRFALRMTLMLLLTLLVFGGVFLVKWAIGAQTNQFFDNMPQPAAAISSAVAKTERWSDDSEAVGTLVAVNGTDVTTESGGVVRSIEFEAGQPVQAGAVLVRLNSDNEQATLKSLETSARLAKVQADRWQQLGKDKLVSLDEVQQRVAAAASAQAQADAQRALIAQKTIRAPFSGELGIRKVNLGQFVSPGQPIVSLQQLDPIYVDFSLPERQMDKLKPGSAVRATVDALPGQAFEGAVERFVVGRVEQGLPTVSVEQVVQVLEQQPVGIADVGRIEQALLLRQSMHAQAQDPWANRQALVRHGEIGRQVAVAACLRGDAVDQGGDRLAGFQRALAGFGRRRAPDHVGPDELGEAEVLGLLAQHDQVGQRQREQALAGGPVPARGAFEQLDAAQAVARGQRHQQVFLAGEMLVQGAGGVLALLGQLRHLQAQQAVALDQLLGLVQELVLAAGEFALLAVDGGHCRGGWGAGEEGRMPGEGCYYEPDSFSDSTSESVRVPVPPPPRPSPAP